MGNRYRSALTLLSEPNPILDFMKYCCRFFFKKSFILRFPDIIHSQKFVKYYCLFFFEKRFVRNQIFFKNVRNEQMIETLLKRMLNRF